MRKPSFCNTETSNRSRMRVAGPGPSWDQRMMYCQKLVKLKAVWACNPAMLSLSLPKLHKFPLTSSFGVPNFVGIKIEK